MAKKPKYCFSGLIKGSIYNPGSVTKLSHLKIKCSFKSYTQSHNLNVVSDDLHFASEVKLFICHLLVLVISVK